MDRSNQYHKLAFYTLSLRDDEFIHQHMLDAYGAQAANEETKPISLFFSLAGLYLLVEKQYTGREVQRAHQKMAAKTKQFIAIALPESRGEIVIEDVLAQPGGIQRNLKIMEWCRSVWSAYSGQHNQIKDATDKLLS